MANVRAILNNGALVLLLLTYFVQVAAQEALTDSAEAILLDEFGVLSHCDFIARIDVLMTELSQKPDHQGYIFTYKSTNELPADRNSFSVEQRIVSQISFRNFDRARITFVRAGYLTDLRTQLWLVPPGADPPRGLDALPAPALPKDKTFLFGNRALASDTSEYSLELGVGIEEPLPEFVLESVKARELAEQAELEKQFAEEAADEDHSGHDPSSDTTSEAILPAQPVEEEAPIEEPVDPRTEEEREAARFDWANVGIAEFISARKGSSGVIIFYADDERYDIRKLATFVKRGRDQLAKGQGIPASRLKVVFGGYRHSPAVEFWFVPAKGKAPRPTPHERPVDDPEEVENS